MSEMTKRNDLTKLVKDYAVYPSAVIDEDFTIEEALECLRHKKIEDKIIYIYVVDQNQKLRGVVPTRALLLKDPKIKISDIMQSSVICLRGSQSLREAMEFLETHRLLALPVVDENKKFIGIIDVDLYLDESIDIVNARRRNDVFQMMGVYLEEGRALTLFKSYSLRMPWIFCNMIGGFACAIISRIYENVLAKVLLLAMFIPLVLTLSESISMQSMTQSLEMTRSRHRFRYIFTRVFRETNIVGMLSVTCGLIVGSVSLFWGQGLYPALVITIGIAVSVYISAFIGSLMPLTIHGLKLDPKVASGPVVLMFADVITTLIYLTLATWWLL